MQIPLCDVVEPPDFEELLVHYQTVIERDALRQILEFPFDSIQLDRVRHGVRTLAPVIPEHGFVCVQFLPYLTEQITGHLELVTCSMVVPIRWSALG